MSSEKTTTTKLIVELQPRLSWCLNMVFIMGIDNKTPFEFRLGAVLPNLALPGQTVIAHMNTDVLHYECFLSLHPWTPKSVDTLNCCSV